TTPRTAAPTKRRAAPAPAAPARDRTACRTAAAAAARREQRPARRASIRGDGYAGRGETDGQTAQRKAWQGSWQFRRGTGSLAGYTSAAAVSLPGGCSTR